MARKEYDMLFSMNAQLGAGFGNVFKDAQNKIKDLQKEIVTLNKEQGDIKAYQKQQDAVSATRKRLEELTEQQKRTAQEWIGASGDTADIEKRFEQTEKAIARTTAAVEAGQKKLDTMGDKLRNAGVDVDNFAKRNQELGGKIGELKKEQEAAADAAGNYRAALAASAAVLAGAVVAVKGLAEAFKECTDASVEFESAMTGVAKTTDLTEAEFAAMSKQIKDMATEIPATTTELAAIAETAGQLGIAKNSLLDFTEIMAMLGTATNMTSDEAATMLAQFASITGMNPAEYSNLGSAIVALGNNYATTEKNIADMSQSVAAAGVVAGMSEADIIAISAAVTSLGITSQAGGTSMMKLISDMNSAVSSGNDLDKWARAAGVSADEFAKAWKNDAAGALDTFILSLHDTYEAGGDLYSILDDLGISESRMVTAINSLAVSGDRLTGTLNVANAAWNENAALTTEAEKRYATTQSHLILMQNAYGNLKTTIGDSYTPVLRELYGATADVLGGLEEFASAHPGAVRSVSAFLGVLALGTVGLTGYSTALKVVIPLMKLFKASVPGVALIAGTTLAVAGLVAVIAGLSSAADEAKTEVYGLTEASRDQYFEIQALQSEYNSLIAVSGEEKEEARNLRYEIEDLSAAYEATKVSAAEYAASMQKSAEKSKEDRENRLNDLDEIGRRAYEIDTLINSLPDLLSGNGNKDKIKAVIDALDEKLPGIGASFDKTAEAGGNFIEIAQSTAKAQTAWELYNKALSGSTENLTAVELKNKEIADTTAELEAAQKRFDAVNAQRKANTLNGGPGIYNVQEFNKTKNAIDEYEKSLALLKGDLNDLENESADYASVIENYTGKTGDATEGNLLLQSTINDVTGQVKELALAYDAVYDAALESVRGQYKLWDEVDKIVPMSAGAINSALESQITYWRDYDANLKNLSARGADIEKLSEVVASLADGGEGGAKALAGLAAMDDTALRKTVEAWTESQKVQEGATKSITEAKTGFTKGMEEFQTELEDAITKMSLGEKAAQSGKDTILGFISGATEMSKDVQDAYAGLGQTAINALHSRFPGTIGIMANVDGSLAKGLGYVPYDGYIAELHRGERVLTSEEARSQDAALLGDSFSITLSPQYNISGRETPDELRSVFAENNENLRELIEDVLRQRSVDAARRAYN
jgi:TP901 family phage tail tape measure protein